MAKFSSRKKTARSLRRHFSDEGFAFVKPELLHRKLVRAMGAERRELQMDISDESAMGLRPREDLYETVRSVEEANLLMSFQAKPMLDAYTALAGRILDSELTVGRIIEVGCWTGSFCRWLSRRCQADIVGIDRASVTGASGRSEDPTNLQLVQGDYASAAGTISPAEMLIGAFPLDTEMFDDRWPLGLKELSESPVLRRYEGEFSAAFKSWYELCLTDAAVHLVLRLPNADSVAGTVAAAANAGFKVLLSDSEKVTSGPERFPLLTFRKADGDGPSAEEVASWYEGSPPPLRPGSVVRDWNARRAFADLECESVDSGRIEYDDGHVMEYDVGTLDGASYLFREVTTGFCQLSLHEADELDELRRKETGGTA